MAIPILTPEQHWVCPHCDHTDVTHEARPHSRFHHCRGLLGMWTPMVPEGIKAKVELVERGDYIGDELVQTGPDGVPYQSVVTTRDEGSDCAVYAPTATGRIPR